MAAHHSNCGTDEFLICFDDIVLEFLRRCVIIFLVIQMKKEELIEKYNKLQTKFGSAACHSIYGGGLERNPDLCLVFVNPTARNVAASKSWTGIRCPWLGMKKVWKFLCGAGLFDGALNSQIQNMKASEWTPEFCAKVYEEVAKNGVYITNLAKCTQDDARSMPDAMYMQYKDLLFEEISLVNPKKIILFGNQVSSIVLGKKISVSQCRKTEFDLVICGKKYRCFPVYYPVGNGFFNAPKAIEDLQYILKL